MKKIDSRELGKIGEGIAVKYLEEKGFEIIERNYRFGKGEIDIIAKDPADGFLAFTEVKTRQNLEFGEPEYAITKAKQKQIRKIAELYLYEKEIENIDCRFDVIAILLEDMDNPKINHYINAFM